MVILGINQVSGLLTGQHDGAAALIKDGKLIATAEEERFNRQRHAKGYPTLAIAYCLKEAGLTEKDIDIIAVGYNPYAFIKRGFFFLSFLPAVTYIAGIFIYHFGLQKIKKASGAKVIFIDHHLAHAASTYRCSGFKDVNALTVDGAGETETVAFYEGRNGTLTKRARINFAKRYDRAAIRSVGKAYTRLTSFLKLGAHGEGKTMGLASYGTPRFDMSKILAIRSFSDYTIDRRNINGLYRKYERKSEKDEITQDQKDLAASLQDALEVAVVNLGKDANRMTGIRHFALAGGCALNCNANSRLLAQDFCDGLFVQPASNDSGIALGAALEAMHLVGDGDFIDFQHAYWGPGYDSEHIEHILKESKVAYRRPNNVIEETADLIASGKIVGWFQGRMELGPRALGNRSILANPAIKGINDTVNYYVKHREPWRPFAPAITEEDAPRYFEGVEKTKASPFMLETFYVKKELREKLPAITHIDGSARIQTVRPDQNERLYALLKALETRTGHPMVLNTSFNDAGEPIVCTPRDAMRCYFATGMDVLVLGDFILEKQNG